MLELKGITVDEVKIGDRVIKVKGLPAKKVYEFFKKVGVSNITGGEIPVDKAEEMNEFIIQNAMKKEDADFVLENLDINELNKLVEFIYKLSGINIGEESQKNS